MQAASAQLKVLLKNSNSTSTVITKSDGNEHTPLRHLSVITSERAQLNSSLL